MSIVEEAQRARVVALAREWIGTPYRHQARIRGVGGDCTFFSEVYADAGLIPRLEVPPYAPQAHLHRAAGIYLDMVTQHAREVDAPRPGDIVLYHIGREFSLGGVVVDPGWPAIVHGDMAAGLIIEAVGDQGSLAAAKDRKFFSLW